MAGGRTSGIGNFQDDLEPIAKISFKLGLGREVNSRRDMFFKVEGSDKMEETYLELGDIGTVPELDGELDYEGLAQGYKMVISNKEYAKGLQIERRYIRTSQHNIAKQLPEMLGLAMRRRIAGDSVAWWNNAFNTTYVTKDGLQLCSSAHTSANGGSNQANRIVAAFSGPALEAAKITMRKFMTNTDNEMDIVPDMLIGGIDLDGAFQEVIESKWKVDTANNNVNVHQGKYTAVTDVRITDSDNWGLIDKELMKQFLIWQNVDPIEFNKAENFDGFVAKYNVYTFYGFGATGWEWILGSEVN